MALGSGCTPGGCAGVKIREGTKMPWNEVQSVAERERGNRNYAGVEKGKKHSSRFGTDQRRSSGEAEKLEINTGGWSERKQEYYFSDTQLAFGSERRKGLISRRQRSSRRVGWVEVCRVYPASTSSAPAAWRLDCVGQIGAAAESRGAWADLRPRITPGKDSFSAPVGRTRLRRLRHPYPCRRIGHPYSFCRCVRVRWLPTASSFVVQWKRR